jgi:hydrogenase maturation protease
MTASRWLPRSTALVVGLGSRDRGDDAVGGHVARAVAALEDPLVEVLVHEDPTDLVELWTGHDRVVVVDATCGGGAPGTVHRLETGAGLAPLPGAAWSPTGRGGTHAFGLGAAVELARALGRLPARVTVIGVEAQRLDHGAPLSPPVAAAVPGAVDAVLVAVRGGTSPGRGSTTDVDRDAGEIDPGRGRADVPG